MKRAEHQPETVAMSLYGGIFAKAYSVLDAGIMIPQHAHTSPHITALTEGTITVWADDVLLGNFTAPAFIKIAAHVKHRFLTKSPCMFLCIHASETEDVDIHAEHALELED